MFSIMFSSAPSAPASEKQTSGNSTLTSIKSLTWKIAIWFETPSRETIVPKNVWLDMQRRTFYWFSWVCFCLVIPFRGSTVCKNKADVRRESLFKQHSDILYIFFLLPDGPFDDNVQVSPVQFVTNWSQSFNLTCLVTDVYPLPSCVWNDVTCDNGNKGSTCTFTPHSPTEMTEATCIVQRQKIDGFGNKLASNSVQLNYKCKYKFYSKRIFDFCNALDEIKIIHYG